MNTYASLELAPISQFIISRGNKAKENILAVAIGIVLLSLLAQVAIPLPWTPVPVTGQTFGVSLMALLWGRKRAFSVILGYLFLGGIGLPIFALGKSGLSFGPTIGYLIGMALAAVWMGTLSDRGWTKTWLRTYLVALSGSVIIFSCGVFCLSFFLPFKNLLITGVLPFLPGDLIKSLLASYIAFKSQKINNY